MGTEAAVKIEDPTRTVTVYDADTSEPVGTATCEWMDDAWYVTVWNAPAVYADPEDEPVQGAAIHVAATCTATSRWPGGARCTNPVAEEGAAWDVCHEHVPDNACDAGVCGHDRC